MKPLILLIELALALLSFSDNSRTDETSTLTFDIEDYSWLAGSWSGTGLGGLNEETWSKPVNGTMMGMFRHIKDGEPVFYEFLLLDETGIRLKHFNPDLTGWEEKDDMTTFQMISYSKDKIEMKGLVIEKKSDTEMETRLQISQNGEIRTEVFRLKRVDP